RFGPAGRLRGRSPGRLLGDAPRLGRGGGGQDRRQHEDQSWRDLRGHVRSPFRREETFDLPEIMFGCQESGKSKIGTSLHRANGASSRRGHPLQSDSAAESGSSSISSNAPISAEAGAGWAAGRTRPASHRLTSVAVTAIRPTQLKRWIAWETGSSPMILPPR